MTEDGVTESSVPGAVGERPALLRKALEEIAEGTEPDRIGRYDLLRDWVHKTARTALDRSGGAVGEREELRAALDMLERMVADCEGASGSDTLMTVQRSTWGEAVRYLNAHHPARLSVNEGGVAPVARTEAPNE